jgi:hypothetical protein
VLLQHLGEHEVHMACKLFEEAWTMDDVEEGVQALYGQQVMEEVDEQKGGSGRKAAKR